MNINDYLNSWTTYYIDCELRCKGRAKLNNDAKRKLRQYHLERYVSQVDSPFGFIFTLKYKHKSIFKHISGGNEIYRVTLQKRQEYFERGKNGGTKYIQT